jgi:hypothetical protein
LRRLFIITVILLGMMSMAYTQVIDTSKMINTWKLMHNFTRFEETPLDTNLHQVHRDYNPVYRQGFSYEYLGNLGQPLNHVDFFLRPKADDFVFGTGWNPYLNTPERTVFYNTRSPFTILSYCTNLFVNQAPEEAVEALHTQNMSPFTNFGLTFNILSGKPYYYNQESRVTRVGLFGSHAKDRYSIFGTLYYNDFRNQDNGGIEDLDGFKAGTGAEETWLYSVRLTEAKSRYRNLSFFTTQKYNLVERVTTTDTLGNTTTTGKTLSISHQLFFDRHIKTYFDEVDTGSLSPLYTNYYYETGEVPDSVSEDKLSNVIQVILGDPDYDRISARAFAGHELRRFGMRSPRNVPVFSYADTISQDPLQLDSVYRDSAVARFDDVFFNDIFVGFHMAGPTTGTWDWIIDGKYYLLGYYRHDFLVNATFSRKLFEKADLGLRGSMELRRPHYFADHYSSSFFRWEHEFPSLFMIRGEAFSRSEEMEMDLRASIAYMRNYLYWNAEALPSIYDQDILVLSGSFSKHFTISGFNSEDKILVQYSTAGKIMPLPLLAGYSSNYWKQSLFKGALVATLGFDVYCTTRYQASAYMPATGVFYLQDEQQAGGYPFLDVFFAFRIARTRIFASYNNLLHGSLLGNNYFLADRYPVKPRNLRLGLVWTFYD